MLLSLPFVGALVLMTSGARYDVGSVARAPEKPAPLEIPVAQALPDNPYQAAMELIRLGRPAEAEQRLAALIAEKPELTPYLSIHIARARLAAGDIPAATQMLRDVAAIKNRAVGLRALTQLAELYSTTGNYRAALTAWFETAQRQEGDAARTTRITIAKAMLASGEKTAARQMLFEVMRMDGSPQVTASAAVELLPLVEQSQAMALQFATIFYDAGEFGRAADEYAKLSAASPSIMFRHARALERADRFREAIEVFKNIRRLHPEHAAESVKYRIGLCYQRIGQDAEGEKYFDEILASNPRTSLADDILYRKATRRDQKELRPEALALYRQLLAKYPRSSWADEAAWKIGLAYLEDGRPDAAEAAFTTALKRYPRSDYAPAMGYWRGKILEQSGNRAAAIDQYHAVLRNAVDPYYRGRASASFRRLGGTFTESDLDAAIEETRSGDMMAGLAKIRAIRDANTGEISAKAREAAREAMTHIGYWSDLSRFSTGALDVNALLFDLDSKDSVVLKELNALVSLGAFEEATAELQSLNIDAGSRPERQLAMTRLLAEGGAYRSSIRRIESLLSTVGGPRDAAAMPGIAPHLLYPRYYSEIVKQEAAKYNLDYRFVLAVMREESRFQADVSSWAGAQGLMQIMPTTGAMLAKQLNIPGFRREMLLKPEVNIAMGTFFLSQLLANNNGKHYLALASYNAGPGNANRWIRQNPGIDEEFLVERITFKETRNYVKKVLGTYWTYRQLDGEILGAS